MPSERRFYYLCAGELCTILVGFLSIPAAAALQIVVPLLIFRDLVLPPHAYQPFLFVIAIASGTIIFMALLLFFRHTMIPLLILAGFTLITFFSVIIAESRIERHFGGA